MGEGSPPPTICWRCTAKKASAAAFWSVAMTWAMACGGACGWCVPPNDRLLFKAAGAEPGGYAAKPFGQHTTCQQKTAATPAHICEGFQDAGLCGCRLSNQSHGLGRLARQQRLQQRLRARVHTCRGAGAQSSAGNVRYAGEQCEVERQ